MPNLIVTYDLRNQRDYKALINAIKTYGVYVKIFESVWYVRSTTHSAEQCRDYLQKFIDSDDRLGVFDCSNNNFATIRAMNKIASLWES